MFRALRKQKKIEVKVLVGNASIEIIREVLRYQRDLVIKSVWKTSIGQQLFGSTDLKLLRKCPWPGLVDQINSESRFSKDPGGVGLQTRKCRE